MNVEHTRTQDGVQVPCDGKMIDISTMVEPNRYKCTRCRVVKTVTHYDQIDEAALVDPPQDRPVGILRRLLR